MSESEGTKNKDRWDKADTVGKLLIPIAIALATFWFDSSLKNREAKQKTFEVAIGILQAPKSDETQQLRQWALGVFQNMTGIAKLPTSPGANKELQQGTQLPLTSQLQMPNPERLRISIIRVEGTPADQSEQIKSALIDANYTNVTTTERPQSLFPDKAEIRFYYPSDSQNAQSLNNYINKVLGITIQVNDRSQDQDASRHRPGDLHVYIRLGGK